MIIYVVIGAAYNGPYGDDVFWVAKATTDKRSAESFVAAAKYELHCLELLLARREVDAKSLVNAIDPRMPLNALPARAGYEYQIHEIPLDVR